MPRELRKRSSRPNYAALLQYDEDEDEGATTAGPSLQQQQEVIDSGSDFAPEKDAPADPEIDDGSSLSDRDQDELMEEAPSEAEEDAVENRASGAKTTKKKLKHSVTLAPSPAMARQYTLPSVHHRHRAIPLYNKKGLVERLAKKPRLFGPDEVVPTNAWGASRLVLGRVGKSWGFNAGPGPLWDLVEDRGWYRESAENADSMDERYRRPRVHVDVRMQPAWQVISAANAELYVPGTTESMNENGIKCSFGAFDKQTQLQLPRFAQVDLEKFFPGSTSHVFNAGAPVWGLDWCPIYVDDRAAVSQRQFLAVAPLPSYEYTPRIGVKVPRPNPACIQIWSLNPPQPSGSTTHGKSGSMKCDVVLCTDIGPAHDLKWCPLPSHDPLKGPNGFHNSARKLGLLAGTFEDGSLSIFAVPYPDDIRAQLDVSGSNEPVYFKISEPLLRFELEDTACWCLDWANSEIIAVGCSNGCIVVYDIAEALQNPQHDAMHLPIHYFSVHQSAIRSVAWIRTPTATATADITADDPTVIVSAAFDGLLAAFDTRAPCGNEIYRTRDVISTVCYAPYCGGPVSIDQGQVKSVSFAPLMLNKGHTVTEPDGPLWNLNASDYHPQLAIAVADGSCSTTNTLRTTRRGGSVPFFLHKIYQLDYNRETKEYRMLEHFLPREIDKIAGNKTKSVPKATGSWPPEVGVHRVVWNNGNGLGKSGLLASATASGLCRIDWLAGRWSRDRVPYTGIEGIRAEVDADEDMDEDSD